jgi:unspecific peroxygenase
MGNDLAVLVAWGAFLVDGNQLTNLMSIGQKSNSTGTDPPPPAIVGGLNTHKVFEGGLNPENPQIINSCVFSCDCR